MTRYDVAIWGGGPAGSAAAIMLARAGLSVIILERTAYQGTRIGESLPPAVKVPLTTLGLWPKFLEQGHHSSPGITAAWGGSKAYESDFIFTPYGCGWQLDRCAFDKLLASHAQAQGAELRCSTEVVGCEAQGRGGWTIQVRGAGTDSLKADFLIDASGRTAWAGRGWRRDFDDLRALTKVAPVFSEKRLGDRRTLVEAFRDGWWYSAFLPGSRMIFACLTDQDLLPRGREKLSHFWHDALKLSPLTRARAAHCRLTEEVRMARANSSLSSRIAGRDWAAVGDAAMAFDPLSGRGVFKALDGGIRTSQQILNGWVGDSVKLTGLYREAALDFAEYLTWYREFYRREQRWSGSPFWQRRHSQLQYPSLSPPLGAA